MSVYVDVLVNRGWRLRGHHVASCHMVADTLEELHDMALRIGMKHSWFQGKASTPHYDLTGDRRKAALDRGAIALNRSAFVDVIRRLRNEAPA
jgi:hypothetical protein